MPEPARQRPIGNPGIVTVIVGSKFKGRPALEAITRMRPGEDVELRRCTNHDVLKHDVYAVECHYGGIFVGFLSRIVNSPVARAFDQGLTPTAIVIEGGRVDRGWVKQEPRITVRWS